MSQKLKMREAVSALLQELEKDGIKALLRFIASIIWATYGIPIAAIATFLVGLGYWLNIPITIPASLVVLFLGFVLFMFLRLRKLEANRRAQKPKNIVLNGLHYEANNDGTIIGPLCTHCRGKMLMVYDQDENVTRVIFGKDALYKYICTCGHEVVASKISDELQKEAHAYFQINRLKH